MNSVVFWAKQLAERKKYIELVGSILSIPVLITVIILNSYNLNKNFHPADSSQQKSSSPQKQPNEANVLAANTTSESLRRQSISEAPQPTDAPEKIIITVMPTPSSSVACTPEVGDVKISSPSENDAVTGDSVCFEVSNTSENDCAVVYSYRINNGSWSDYQDKPSCLYNMASGNKQLDVRVKSVVSGEVKTLTRKFTYQSNTGVGQTQTVPTNQPTPESTSSAIIK